MQLGSPRLCQTRMMPRFFEPPDEWDEWYLNAIGQPVPKEGREFSFLWFSGAYGG